MSNDPIQLDEFRSQVDGKIVAQRLARATNHRGAPARKSVLELNQTLREAKHQMGHLDIGSIMMQIPEFDFYVLMRRFPELNSPDQTENANAWEKFLRSPRSEQYRVRKGDGKRKRGRWAL